MNPHNMAMALRKAYLSMHRATNRALAKFDVTADQFVCLVILETEDGISQKELAQRATSDPNTIRAMLVLLEKKKLIIRKSLNSDKRTKIVLLTSKGKTVLKKMVAELESVRKMMNSNLTADERKKGMEILHKIDGSLNQ